MKPMSLAVRVFLPVAAVLVVAVGVIDVVAYVEMKENLLGHIDQTLRAMAEGVVAALDDQTAPPRLEAEVRAITGYAGTKRTTRYRLWGDEAASDLIASDPPASEPGRWLRQLPDAPRPPDGTPVFLDVGVNKREHRAIWLRQAFDGRTVNILIAHDSHGEDIEMQEFRNLLLTVGGGVVLVAVAASMLLVRLGISPIARTARQLRRLTDRNLAHPDLGDSRTPRELAPFIESVRDLLARLDAAIIRQRQFTADASHELRTPLTSVKSTLQLAQIKDRTGQEYRSAIAETLQDIARMERLIEQLLELARLDASADAPPRDEVSLDQRVRETVESFAAAAAEAHVALECPTLPPTHVRGDAAQLTRVLGNLVDNAIRYGPRGGTVSVAIVHEDALRCAVTVRDAGGDIPADVLAKAFDRFYRADASRGGPQRGAGLGLAIAREIARRHGGDVTLESDPAGGTLATLGLPRLA